MNAGKPLVVLDTNAFVAAGFRPGSASAQIVQMVKDRKIQLVWDGPTRTEIDYTLGRIPQLSADLLEGVFLEENFFGGTTRPDGLTFVEDPADRKFAALAIAAGAVLVSSDNHLLSRKGEINAPVLRPVEFLASLT